MIVIRDHKICYFDFDCPKDIGKTWKHEVEFIIKSNESLAENKTNNKIEKLLPR